MRGLVGAHDALAPRIADTETGRYIKVRQMTIAREESDKRHKEQ